MLPGEESRGPGDRDSGTSPPSLSTDYRGSYMTSLEHGAHFHQAEARGGEASSSCLEPHREVGVQEADGVNPMVDSRG